MSIIYIIKKYKSLEIYSSADTNILNFFNLPLFGNTKLSLKIYKYLLSLNIYYTKCNTYYPRRTYRILSMINNTNLILNKINNQQEIWRKRRLFILLCIL